MASGSETTHEEIRQKPQSAAGLSAKTEPEEIGRQTTAPPWCPQLDGPCPSACRPDRTCLPDYDGGYSDD